MHWQLQSKMALVAVGASLVLGGCGRISFDPRSDGGVDASRDTSPPADAQADAADAADADAGVPDGAARPTDCPPLPAPCLDSSFGLAGTTVLDMTWTARVGSQFQGIAVHGDGFVIVGATGTDANHDFAVVRLDRTGSVDRSFGVDGLQSVDVGPNDTSHSVATAGDGTIFVSGNSAGQAHVISFTAIGDPSSVFGSAGVARVDFAASNEFANGIALLADGRVVVGGQGFPGGGGGSVDLMAARVLADGSGLDPTFGASGTFVHDFSGTAEFGSLIAGRAGELVLPGSSDGGATAFDCVLVRVTQEGAHVASARHDVAGGVDRCHYAAVHPGGGYVAAGYATGADTDHVLFRFREDLSLDPSFGMGGHTVVDAGGDDQASAIAVLGDGRIVVGGGFTMADGLATLWVVAPDGAHGPSALMRIDLSELGVAQRMVSLLADTPTSVLALFTEEVSGAGRLVVQRYLF